MVVADSEKGNEDVVERGGGRGGELSLYHFKAVTGEDSYLHAPIGEGEYIYIEGIQGPPFGLKFKELCVPGGNFGSDALAFF